MLISYMTFMTHSWNHLKAIEKPLFRGVIHKNQFRKLINNSFTAPIKYTDKYNCISEILVKITGTVD